MERSWIKNILKRQKGWYKNSLFFSLIPLIETVKDNKGLSYSVSDNFIDLNNIKSYIQEILKDLPKRVGKKVKITNIKTKESIVYLSKRQAARVLQADPASFYVRNKLFRGIYKIELL